jgi:hypothetical protein
MFPISSEQTLRFIDIADHWAREIKPPIRPLELRDALSKAWWRSEMVAANEPSRVHLLRALYSKCADEIAFVIPGEPEPPCSRPLDDGGVEVFRLVHVPLPNAQSDTWTDANCTDAFSAIADAWDEELFPLLAREVPFIMLTRSEFIPWAEKCGRGRPTFWGRTSEDEDRQQPTNETVPRKAIEGAISDAVHDSDGRSERYALPARPPNQRAAARAHAYRVLFKCWGQKGPPRMGINRIVEETNKRWRDHLEYKDWPATPGGLSDSTVRRVLGLSK